MYNFKKNTHQHILSNKSGFTLLEILFVFFILAIISYQISIAMINAYRTRDNLQKMGAFYTELRLSLGILERDIRLSYTPISALPNPNKRLKEEDKISLNSTFRGTELERSNFWLPIMDMTGIRPARFIGDERSLSFFTASHYRVYKDSPESIFIKARYELRESSVLEEKEKGLLVLYRIIDTNAFSLNDDIDISKKTYPLLRRIKKLSFSYWNQRTEISYKNWDNENSEFRMRYPDRIKVDLTVLSLQNKEYTGSYEFKPEFYLDTLPDTF